MSLLNEIIRGIFQGIKVSQKVSKKLWYGYEDLKTTPYLYDPIHMTNLVKKAIKEKNHEALEVIKEYILRHDAQDVNTYKKIFTKIGKELNKNIDIDDIF